MRLIPTWIFSMSMLSAAIPAPAHAIRQLSCSLSVLGVTPVSCSNTVNSFIAQTLSTPAPISNALIHAQYGALRSAGSAFASSTGANAMANANVSSTWSDNFTLTWTGGGTPPPSATIRVYVRPSGSGLIQSTGQASCNDWALWTLSTSGIPGIRAGGWSCPIDPSRPDSVDQTYSFDFPIAFGAPREIRISLGAQTTAQAANGTARATIDVTANWQGFQVLDNLGAPLMLGVHYSLATESGSLFGVDWTQPIALSPPALPACSDGFDNDADGTIDFPSDVDCQLAAGLSEASNPQVPTVRVEGFIGLALLLLAAGAGELLRREQSDQT